MGSFDYGILASEAQCNEICSILMLEEALAYGDERTNKHPAESSVTAAIPEDLSIPHRRASDPGSHAN